MARRAERKLEEVRSDVETRSKAMEVQRTELDAIRVEFDDLSSELQAKLEEFADRAGPQFFPEDSATVARVLLEERLLDVEPGKTARDRNIDTRTVSKLASALWKYVEGNRALCVEATRILRKGGGETVSNGWDYRHTAEVLATIYAKRMVWEIKAKEQNHWVPFPKLNWKKHMTPSETAHNARVAIESFMHAHEIDLSGRALNGKKAVEYLTQKQRLELHASFDRNSDRDFEAVEKEIVAKFSEMYPSVEPGDRTKSFMDLFELVRAEIKEEGDGADGFAYLVAERIFLKGYEHTAEKMGVGPEFKAISYEGHTKGQRRALFDVRMEEMEKRLTGDIANGKNAFYVLPHDHQVTALRLISNMPDSIVQATQRSINEWLENRPGARDDKNVTLQELAEAVLPTIRELNLESVERGLSDVFPDYPSESMSFLVAREVITKGFEEDERRRMEERARPNVELWGDQQLTQTGVVVWDKTYRIGGSDGDAVRASREIAENWGKEMVSKGVVVNEQRISAVEAVTGFAGKWAVHAFQRITTTHTYAAALMCSDADRAVLEDIEVQWHAFMVCIPDGLLKYHDDRIGVETEYNRILVAIFENQASMILLSQKNERSNNRLVIQIETTLPDLLFVGRDVELIHTTNNEDDANGTKDKVGRIVTMAKRLVSGLLLAMQNTDNFKSKTYPARDGKRQRESGTEPAHRVVFVGAPLKIDCRAAVADFIKNGSPKRKGAPPQVQVLVRGHHKRQVCGVGRTGRKVIWIEPFWRGPEDAPIFTRPKKVG